MKGSAVLHYLRVISGLESPNTQTTRSERDAIANWAKGATTAVEIGVFEGVNTTLIAQTIKPEGVLYGIDPFFKGAIGICYSKLITKRLLKRNAVGDKVKLIEKLSFDAVNDVPKAIDFIFIDGDHSYEGLKKDWELYSPRVVLNGIIALHDTTVPDFDPARSALGSIAFYEGIISKDDRFLKLQTVDSLNILKRIR
jgi:predicted O-methyltransferase YrrM